MSSSTISWAGCVFQTRWAAPGPLPDRYRSELVLRTGFWRSVSGPGEHDLVELPILMEDSRS